MLLVINSVLSMWIRVMKVINSFKKMFSGWVVIFRIFPVFDQCKLLLNVISLIWLEILYWTGSICVIWHPGFRFYRYKRYKGKILKQLKEFIDEVSNFHSVSNITIKQLPLNISQLYSLTLHLWILDIPFRVAYI